MQAAPLTVRRAYTQMKAAVMGVVQTHFRPEFINRLDDIVVFHPLDKAQIREIARIQTRYLAKRLAERQIHLELDDSALNLLGNIGFDPIYGARPLKRTIQTQLENPLAKQILSGDFAPRYGKGIRPGRKIELQKKHEAVAVRRCLDSWECWDQAHGFYFLTGKGEHDGKDHWHRPGHDQLLCCHH